MSPFIRASNWLVKKSRLEKKPSSFYGYLEGWLSILVNLLVFAGKFILGNKTGSIALKADSFHTLSDVATSALIIVGFFLASQPADSRHPFGHGRVEKIVGIIIATLLCVAGYEFFVTSVQRFLHPYPVKLSLAVIVIPVLLISILLKEFLTVFALTLYKTSGYQSLKADAWHHRSDSLATVLVLVNFLLLPFGLVKIDGLLGMLVSLLIGVTGIQLIFESGSVLLGEAPHPELEKNIRTILSGMGIQDVHHIHVHDYSGKLEITMHVRRAGGSSLEEAHAEASRIEEAIKKEIPDCEVTIHSEPLR